MNVATLHPKRVIPILSAIALGFLAFGSRASAANDTWSPSTTGTTWATAGNWSGGAPGSGVLEFGATATNGSLYDNITGQTYEFQFDASAPAYVISGSAFTLGSSASVPAVINNSANVETINDTITWGATTGTIVTSGTGGAIVFGGFVESSVSGGPTFDFDAPQTTFAGGFGMSTGPGARTNAFAGVGNVTISGLSNGASTSADTFLWENSGTLTLAGTTTIFGGPYSFYAGTTVLTGTWVGTASQSNAITVGNATVVTSATAVNTGNATLQITGNYGFGSSGVGNQSVVILGGTGASSGQGTLSLVDGSLNTFTIYNATANTTELTMAGVATKSSVLNMEIGSNSSDEIVLANNGKASIGAGGVTLNIAGVGGFNTGATQNLTLISAPGGGLTAGAANFTGNYANGNFGGYTVATLANSSTSALILTLSGYTPVPTTAYWTGNQSAVWNTLTGGTNNNSNWASAVSSGTDAHQTVGSVSNVYFAASGAGNLSTSLGVSTTINSLTFISASPVSIGGANTLTLAASGANGITVNPGSGADTITGNVALGTAQTWSVNNSPANALTVNGVVSGASTGLTMSGTGELVLGGNNTFTGGLTINNGTVLLNNAGALNASGANGVAFGPSTSTGMLEINGINTTISSLSTNATPGAAVVENGASTAHTLTVAQASNTTYAGVLQDGGSGSLNVVKSGAGSLTLAGANTYTGTTTVSNGTLAVNGSLAIGSAVTVSATANSTTSILGGNGTINGSVTINAATGTGSVAEIMGGTLSTTGTLQLTGGLTLNVGSVANFGNGGYINITTGGLTLSGSGVIIEVAQSLAAGTYPLIGYNGTAPTLSNFVLDFTTGGATGGNYSLVNNSGILDLSVTNATAAIPSLSLTVPANGTRVMANTTVSIGGAVSNAGTSTLNATLADNGGNLTATGFSPGNPIVVGTGASINYTGSVNAGGNLGSNSISVIVTDTNASPTTANASTTVDVLANRVVSASTVSAFGIFHIGSAVSGSTNLTSTGSDNLYTRVTVADSGTDANGISVSGGNPANVFNGSTSDTRTVSGAVSTLGTVNGAITLVTGSEGIAGESPINVTVNYSAQVFSGKAAWSGTGGGTSWATNGNWGDTQSGDLGGAGAPGVSGALSVGDTAAFGDFAGEGSTTSVTLDGATPTLAALTLSGTGTSYTIGTGLGGAITLQGAATPISVTGTHTISAVLTGNGIKMTGSGTLILAGANTYTGATAVANGVLEISSANNILPTGTSLILGDAVANTSGMLVLGGTTSRSQTVASIVTAGTGAANSVVAGPVGISTFTVNNATGTDTFSGILGGSGANQNNLALTKTAAGILALTGGNTYTGPTTINGGTLNVGSGGALGSTSSISFGGGTLQWSAANTTDYSALFSTAAGQAYSLDTNGQTVTLATALGAAGNATLTKTGAGALILSTAPTYTGVTTVSNGTLVAPGLLTNSSKLNVQGNPLAFGIFQVNSATPTTYSPTLGANLGWNTYGGFAAQGSPLTINANGGAELLWNVNGFAAGSGGTNPIAFGSLAANNQVILQNAFDFGTPTASLSFGFNRAIDVEGAPATLAGGTSGYGVSGNSALLSGVISGNAATSGSTTNTGVPTAGDLGSNGFDKTGPGTLILSASNTYSGITNIGAGTIIAATNALSGTAGAFGDGHTVTYVQNSGTVNNVGSQSVVLGFANVNGADGTAATGASPTVLIGGPFTVQVPISVSNITTTGTYGIGGSTDNTSTFGGTITMGQNLSVTQVANSGANALDITGNITTTVGVNTVKTLTFNNVGAVNVSGNIVNVAGAGNGSLNLTQAGSGVTTISSSVTYTGTTTVTGGHLVVSGALSGSQTLVVGPGGELNVDGALGTSSNTSVSGILSGAGSPGSATNGIVGNVAVLNGGTIAPGAGLGGAGIGTLNASNIQLQGGGIYKLKLNNDGSAGAAGAGTNWDQLYFTGLDLTSTSLATNPFVLSLQTLDLSGSANPLASFDPTQSHTWVSIFNFLTVNGTFSASDFAVNTSNFLSATNGGTFSVVLDTANAPSYDTLDLEFTPAAIPEPGTWAMLVGGVGMLVGFQKIRRRKR